MAANIHPLKQQLLIHIRQIAGCLRSDWQQMACAESPTLLLALAFAVGTLVSMVPIPILDMMLAAVVMRVLHRLPRGPIAAAMAVWNSLVMAPLYASSPRVGSGLISVVSSHSSLQVPNATLPRVLVGNVAIACFLVAFSFICATVVFTILRLQRPAMRIRR